MRNRELTIPQLTSFIYDQMWRVKTILNPEPESVIGKVFNTEWLDGSHGNIFPISISKMDIEMWLPRLHLFEGHYYLPLPQPIEYKQKYRESIWKTRIQRVSLEYKLIPSDEDNLIAHFKERVGDVFTSDELHQELDSLNYFMNSGAGRMKRLNALIKSEGLVIVKVRKRVKGERVTLYQVKQVKLVPSEIMDFDYDKVMGKSSTLI